MSFPLIVEMTHGKFDDNQKHNNNFLHSQKNIERGFECDIHINTKQINCEIRC